MKYLLKRGHLYIGIYKTLQFVPERYVTQEMRIRVSKNERWLLKPAPETRLKKLNPRDG